MSVKQKEKSYKSVFGFIFRESNIIRAAIAVGGYFSVIYIPNQTVSAFGAMVPTQPLLAILSIILFILAPDLRSITKKEVGKI